MRDPIKWSTRAVGTTTRFVIMVLGQFIGTAVILAMPNNHNPFSVLFVVLYCFWMSSLFLYALYKVLKELEHLRKSCKTEAIHAHTGSC